MDEMKTNLLTPEILKECLDKESCFHVIKHKRDITLSLNSDDKSKNSKYIADQTPTPTTRLIRNCEEFGLFDDLKHVNPFEETFRQAIDGKTKWSSVLLNTQKSLEIIKSNDEDTLHTPHIIPYNIIGSNDNREKCDNDSQKTLEKQSNTDKQPVIVSNESVTSNPIVVSNDTLFDSIPCREITENIKITQNNEITKKVFRKICPKPVTVVPLVPNPIKDKIRKSLFKLQTKQIDDIKPNIKVPDVKMHIIKTKETDTRDIPKDEIKRHIFKRSLNSHDNSTNERNREAAKRYRHKQKMLHDALIERNEQLEAENAMLKKQLQVLKKNHENCSVSRLHEI